MDVENLKKLFNLPEYAIEIGVIEENTQRDPLAKGLSNPKAKKTSQSAKKGVTNAQILFILENGSPKKHMKPRPVLDKTIEWAESQIQRALERALTAFIEHNYDANAYRVELERFAMRVQSHARRLIYANDGTFEPNAPSTIERKHGVNHPLFDTSQLAKSITCRLIQL